MASATCLATGAGPQTHTAKRWPPLVDRAEAGDRTARDALFAALYDDFHRLAEMHVRRARGVVTLDATTLLHEAYLGIASRDALAFPDRSRFLAYASRAMRGLAINYVRDRRAVKRGGELTFTTLDPDKAQSPQGKPPDVELLSAALTELETMDPEGEMTYRWFFERLVSKTLNSATSA